MMKESYYFNCKRVCTSKLKVILEECLTMLYVKAVIYKSQTQHTHYKVNQGQYEETTKLSKG